MCDKRVQLGTRVNKKVIDEYEGAIIDEYGQTTLYAGVVLEQQLSCLFEDTVFSELIECAQALAETFGEDLRGKEFLDTPRRKETVKCQYRVSKRLKNDLKDLVNETDAVTYPRDLIERVMWSYASGHSVIERAIDRIDRVKSHGVRQKDEIDTKERRTKQIARELSRNPSWTLDAFDEAVDKAAEGLNSGSYAREEYVERVINELDYTWLRTAEGGDVFVSKDKYRDDETEKLNKPTIGELKNKPAVLMDRSDEMTLIEASLVDKARSVAKEGVVFNTSQGKDVLPTNRTHDTVRKLFEEIANRRNKAWKHDNGVLDYNKSRDDYACEGTTGTPAYKLNPDQQVVTGWK